MNSMSSESVRVSKVVPSEQQEAGASYGDVRTRQAEGLAWERPGGGKVLGELGTEWARGGM